MELSEENVALKAENEKYKELINNINSEKLVLDRRYVKELQNSIQLENKIIQQESSLENQKKEIEELKSKLDQKEKELSNVLDNQALKQYA